MKLKSKHIKFIIFGVLIIAMIISSVIMELNRHKGEVIYLQPHEFKDEIEEYINKMHELYTPFTLMQYCLVFYTLFHVVKYLLGDYNKGKFYKVALVVILKLAAFLYLLFNSGIIAESERLVFETGKIITPAIELFVPFIVYLILYVASEGVVKLNEIEYKKIASINKQVMKMDDWRASIREIHEEIIQ